MSDLIPEPHRAAVDRGLRAAFGTAELDAIAPLAGGLSGAAVFRIRVGGIDYVLRLTLARDALRDPARGFACMKIAANACLAPGLRYASAEDGVALMDLIAPQPLSSYPGDGSGLIVELAQAVRLLHRTPAFPPLIDYIAGVQSLLDPLLASGALNPDATGELAERFAGLAAGYRTAPGDRVSSHNDLNPGNILYDGRRLWLVDWEAAFLADRYVDLATAANWFSARPGAADLLLRTYFNGEPTAEQRARFDLMRIVNHVFAGAAFLSGADAADLDDRGLAGPSLAELGAGLARGEVSFARPADRIAYGKARLVAALAGLRDPACAEALARLAA